MARHMSDADVTEAVEVVDADEAVEAGATEDGDGLALVDDGAAGAADDESGEGGVNVYTVLMILSTVAYLAATLFVLNAVKTYSDVTNGKWPLW